MEGQRSLMCEGEGVIEIPVARGEIQCRGECRISDCVVLDITDMRIYVSSA